MLARGQAGLTQQALGAPDLSKSFISLLESGRSYPSVETVVALASRLGTSVASLLMDPADLRRETALNLLRLAAQLTTQDHGAEAIQLTAAAEALLPDMPADLAVRAALVRAYVAIAAGHLDEAGRWADNAAAAACRHRLGSAAGMAVAVKGLIEVRRGMYERAVPALEQAVDILRRTKASRTPETVRALLSLGASRFYLGQIDHAQRAYRRALELSTRLRLHSLRGRALTGLGLVERARGRLGSAAEHFAQAHDALARVEDLAEMARTLTNLGIVRREEGRPSEALAALEQALRIRERLDDARGRSVTLEEMSLTLLQLGRHGDAARIARRAIKDAQASSDQSREAWAQMALARALQAQGRRSEAVPVARGAISTLRRLGFESQAAVAGAEFGITASDAHAATQAASSPSRASADRLPGRAGSSREPALEGPTA